jgi:hypothetical protein
MTKYNNDGLKIFEKDILPSNSNDKTRWLANINDDFFENMGKRGAKKKNSENNYTFSDENHPVLLILSHKNAKLSTQLSIYASQLLKNGNYICQEITPKSIKELDTKKSISKKESSKDNIPNNISNNIGNLISMISTIDKSSPLLNNSKVSKDIKTEDKESEDEESEDEESEDEESEDEESDDDELEDKKSDNNKCIDTKCADTNCADTKSTNSKSTNSKSTNSKSTDPETETETESEEDTSDDEGVSCTPIYTNKKKLLWYNEDNQTIYEPEGDDSGEEIGLLKEISFEYHTICHNEKFYTVLSCLNVKNRGDIFCCVLTDSLFDKDLNFIGTRTKIKNNKYQFDFTN